ncbi:MAG: group III truncated hemoglobin [Flavitalea sp.]
MAEEKTGEILHLDDVRLLVDTFYGKVRNDDIIGPVFNAKIQDRWPEHLEKMYRFWQTLLLDERTYFGRPFPPHAQLPVDWKHFERWMNLFTATVDELFTGTKAEEAKWRAGKMAELFNAKIQHFKGLY